MSSLFSSARNARDLGGHPTRDGGVTAFGRFIRSDAPWGDAREDADALRRLNVTDLIDLRTVEEAAAHPNPWASLPFLSYAHCPITQGSEPPPTLAAVPESYLEIAKAPQMPAVFRLLADAPGCAVFHCTAGKDRTGVVGAVLLTLANVPDDAVVADYVVSRENNRERLSAFLAAHPEVDPDTVRANESSMAAFLSLLRETYGTAEGYLRFIGLSENRILALKEKMRG